MSFMLVSPEGDRRFALNDDELLVAGRDLTCAFPILDSRVSRRHAELRSGATGVELRDLGSRNGTWINGERIEEGSARSGDLVAFGGVSFMLIESASEAAGALYRPPLSSAPTIVRERSMPSREAALAAVARKRLSQLVASAQRLGAVTSVESMLQTIVDDLFITLAADRVAVLLPDSTGTLTPRIARDRLGSDVIRAVPSGIAAGVAERQVALLTHDARHDARTVGETVVRQEVRSAMAAPLIGEEQVTLGVLYVDNTQNTHAFSDADLGYLIAYAGLAAVTAQREVTAARLYKAAQVRENFERYFTPQLAARIAAETGRVAPGGERRNVVVLFSDIRGFTALAETLPPMQMAAQLNEYLEAMVECVFRHQGALDKFIGDALLAYWGAPEAFPDDTDRAIASAIDMQRELVRLNEGWRGEGRPALGIGIGVHRGDAFVGNIGSPRRLEYTLIGDTVNIADRLCSDAQRGEVLVSDQVREGLIKPLAMHRRPDVMPERRAGPAIHVWSVGLP